MSCKLNVMLSLHDIHSLSDFQRNTKEYLRKLKRSGKPAVLTVNGHAEVVIQSAEAYQRLLDDQQFLETIRGISRPGSWNRPSAVKDARCERSC